MLSKSSKSSLSSMFQLLAGLTMLAGSGEKIPMFMGSSCGDLNPDRVKELDIDLSESNKSNRKDEKYGKGKGSKKLPRSKRKR